MRILYLFCGAVMAVAGQTPDLFVVPGEVLGSRPEVGIYSADLFARVATVPTQLYVTQFLAHPDGTRFYAISRLGPDGVRVLSATAPYPELKRLPVIDTIAAAISPDGRRLVLIGRNDQTSQNVVTLVDLQTDTIAARLSIPYSLRDQVVISADSSRAFFLTISPGLLYAADLTTNTLAPNPLTVPVGFVVRAAPNGLVYLLANKYLVEVDGTTLKPWESIPLPIGERPQNVALSTDGEYAIAGRNLIHLATRRITEIPLGSDRITVIGPKRAFIGSMDTQWTGGAVETITQTPVPTDLWFGTATQEFPSARYLLTTAVDGLRRYSFTGKLGVYDVMRVNGSEQYQLRPGSGAPARLERAQMQQTIRRSDRPQPLVARVFDAAGKPLANVAVSFRSTLLSTTIRTAADGSAVAQLPPGLSPGSYPVTAEVPGLPGVNFVVTVEEDPSGPVQLVPISGLGDYQNGQSGHRPIVVQLRDLSGRPRPREAVTFQVRSGLGTLGPVTAGTCAAGECVVWTDRDGYAAIDFLPRPELIDQTAPMVETIVATAGGVATEVRRTILPPTGGVRLERLSPAGASITGLAGELIPNGFRARVVYLDRAQRRTPLPGISVQVLIQLVGHRPAFPCEAMSDGEGFVSCPLRWPLTPGQGQMIAVVGGNGLENWREIVALTVHPNRPVVTLGPVATGQTNAERLFEISAFRPGTDAPFGILNLLVNSALDGRRACYVAFAIAERQLYLVNDAGPEAGLSAPLTLGGSGTVSNGQCTVLSEGSSFTGTPERPVLRLRVRFAPGFGGPRLVQVASRTRNDAESSGWQIAVITTLPTANVTFGPRVSLGHALTRLENYSELDFRFADATGGFADLLTVWGLAGPSIDARTGCVFAYYVPGNLITLYPDSGVPTGAMVPFAPGATLENSRCRLELVSAERSSAGLRLLVRVAVKPPFAGSNALWGAASTVQNLVSPWTPLAAWRVD
jgi:hypothetical protein